MTEHEATYRRVILTLFLALLSGQITTLLLLISTLESKELRDAAQFTIDKLQMQFDDLSKGLDMFKSPEPPLQ